MKIASRAHRLIATSLLFFGLASGLSHAQRVFNATVNSVPCTSAQEVSVSITHLGGLAINTGGCGTALVLPPNTSPPQITSLSAPSGAPGSTVTIYGSNLANASVTIGAAAANPLISNIATQITATVPSNASGVIGGIVVTTNVAPAATFPFTVSSSGLVAPTVTSVSPPSARVNASIIIYGTALTGGTVTIGTKNAPVSNTSATEIRATVPSDAPVTNGNGNGNLVVTTRGGSASQAFVVDPTVVSGDVSIEGISLPNPSKFAFVIPPPRAGLEGAGVEVKAYAMAPSRCTTANPALTRSWQHNITQQDYRSLNAFDYFSLATGESLTYKFTMGDVDASGGFVYLDAAASGGAFRPTFMSITSTPCDFNLAKLQPATRDVCYQTSVSSANIGWVNISGAAPSFCRLMKGQTYYFNLRFQDGRPPSEGGPSTPQDSCIGGVRCGGLLQVL